MGLGDQRMSFLLVIIMSLFSTTFGGANHPTRHHHSDRGIVSPIEVDKNNSSGGNEASDETLAAPTVPFLDPNTPKGIHDSASVSSLIDLNKKKNFQPKSDIKALSFNPTLDNTFEESNPSKDRNKYMKGAPLAQYLLNFGAESGNKSQPSTKINLPETKGDERFGLTTPYTPPALFRNENEARGAFRMFHSLFDEGQMRSSMPLKALSGEEGGHHFMFTRHNITVETLNYSRSREKKTESAKSTDVRRDAALDGVAWSVSLNEKNVNLNNTSTKIFAQVGGDALLPCRVGHLGDRQVSWIRRRDWYVLTSGDSLYTHDKRFVVLHEKGSQDWTLHIKKSVKGDSGVYECQVSTGTGIISFFVQLNVVTPTAHIPGNGRTHVFRGSPFTIICYIVKSPAAIQHVMWYQNGVYLNYKRERPDIVITTRTQRTRLKDSDEDFPFEGEEDEDALIENDPDKNVVVSRLKVDFATEDHSGNYTCSAPNVRPDSTLIYVTEGDKTAAVQRIDSGKRSNDESSFVSFFLVALICAVR